MDRTVVLLVIAIMALVLPGAVSAASDLEITKLYASPSDPEVREDFEIKVRAESSAGMDTIELYIDGDYEDSEDCDGDERCSVTFDVYETGAGSHRYKVKAYDLDDDVETDQITVDVEKRNSHPLTLTAYATPTQVQVNQQFSIYASAYDQDGVDRMEVLFAGSVVGSQGCGSTSCSRTFAMAPRPAAGTYNYDVKAYDESGAITTSRVTINVMQPAPQFYCGDGTCNSGETCSSCEEDCGECYVEPMLPVIYTCSQRGGQCCAYGGTGVVDGGADCPSACFSRCNPAPQPANGGSTPTGAATTVDAPVLILAVLVLMMLLLLYIAAKV